MKQTKKLPVLIRKVDMNLNKYDTKNKNLFRNLENSDDYIDPIDLEMLRKK